MTVARHPSLHATPTEATLEMPTQSLSSAPRAAPIHQVPGVYAARLVAFGGAALLTWYGYTEMTRVFGNETSTPLQGLLLALFTITFGWIALSATQGIAALFAPRWAQVEAPGRLPKGRTAILMPVYNEDPSATCAALQAMGEGLADLGVGEAFEIFVLSDTTDPRVWVRETACFAHLREALSGVTPVWYRRRPRNIGRKAGNLRDFVERWGARYDYMIVLDADSLMAPRTILRMAQRMDAAPRLGILQTVPVLFGGTTVFARIQQFAGRLYGPVIARGVSAWQGLDGNYWGHNAIIRVGAFAACCGLPELPGRMPFGGHVLSHDFVEAALIRRGGWEVRMDTDLGGSWEGSPQTLLDLAARDRRWAQGNLQHIKVVGARGLKFSNRAHFLIGIGSYLMSTIWLALLITGAALTAQSLIYEREYFGDTPQLFPNWPVFDAKRMIWLLALSMALLFLPKMMGVARAIARPRIRKAFGGGRRILAGAGIEVVLSALYAPILMLFQVQQVMEIFLGRDSGWSAQSRDAATMSWRQAFTKHWLHWLVGLAASAAVLWFAPAQLVWVIPVLLGLVLSPVLSRASGTPATAPIFRFLRIPEDINPPAAARRAAALRPALRCVAEVTPAILLSSPDLLQKHLSSEPTDGTEGRRSLDRITARAKIAEAESAEEAVSWLTRSELIALLGNPDLLIWASERPAIRGPLRSVGQG
ncbi:MAG: glucans biosynthesis glucosyltransferase MdoH [Rhodobacteraceae bacterium]|nr:glucans biosynthesis glucosyltransferase MdoH [Paracoccaceae bacterium]